MKSNKITLTEKLIITILSELSEKQMSVLIQRFVHTKTQKEIGIFFNMTNERVRQHENKGLKIIQDNLKNG